MYKKDPFGRYIHLFQWDVLSEDQAKSFAWDKHRSLGLIGWYYCETSSGKCFHISG